MWFKQLIEEMSPPKEGLILNDIHVLLFEASNSGSCFVPHDRNKATHSLTKFVLCCINFLYELEKSLNCISHIASE